MIAQLGRFMSRLSSSPLRSSIDLDAFGEDGSSDTRAEADTTGRSSEVANLIEESTPGRGNAQHVDVSPSHEAMDADSGVQPSKDASLDACSSAEFGDIQRLEGPHFNEAFQSGGSKPKILENPNSTDDSCDGAVERSGLPRADEARSTDCSKAKDLEALGMDNRKAQSLADSNSMAANGTSSELQEQEQQDSANVGSEAKDSSAESTAVSMLDDDGGEDPQACQKAIAADERETNISGDSASDQISVADESMARRLAAPSIHVDTDNTVVASRIDDTMVKEQGAANTSLETQESSAESVAASIPEDATFQSVEALDEASGIDNSRAHTSQGSAPVEISAVDGCVARSLAAPSVQDDCESSSAKGHDGEAIAADGDVAQDLSDLHLDKSSASHDSMASCVEVSTSGGASRSNDNKAGTLEVAVLDDLLRDDGTAPVYDDDDMSDDDDDSACETATGAEANIFQNQHEASKPCHQTSVLATQIQKPHQQTSLSSRLAECRAKLVELQNAKQQQLDEEDYMGAHATKQLIQEQEQKLNALQQELIQEQEQKLDCAPTPARGARLSCPAASPAQSSRGPRVSLAVGPSRRLSIPAESASLAAAAAVAAAAEQQHSNSPEGRTPSLGSSAAPSAEGDEEENVSETEETCSWQPAAGQPDMVELQSDVAVRLPFRLPLNIFERLFPYQRAGVAWMAHLLQRRRGGVLADEMGLGKTIQVCALLNGARKAGASHALLLMPVTLLNQWAKEARIWCPGWPVHVFHGTAAQRAKALRGIRRPEGGLLITSYSLISNCADLLQVVIDDTPEPTRRRGRPPATQPLHKRRKLDGADDDCVEGVESEEEPPQPETPGGGTLPAVGARIAWNLVICDEAHKMKNMSSLLSRSLRKLESQCRILLTGTPVQNALQDLWALMDFAQPGLLGNHATFVKTFSEPIDRGSVKGAKPWAIELKRHLSEQLRAIISPHLLRRTKNCAGLLEDDTAAGLDAEMEEAGTDESRKLPPKKETVVWLYPSEEQLAAYQKVLQKSEVIKEACTKMKLGVEVFRAIGLLKRLCNHPALLLPAPKPQDWKKILRQADAKQQEVENPIDTQPTEASQQEADSTAGAEADAQELDNAIGAQSTEPSHQEAERTADAAHSEAEASVITQSAETHFSEMEVEPTGQATSDSGLEVSNTQPAWNCVAAGQNSAEREDSGSDAQEISDDERPLAQTCPVATTTQAAEAETEVVATTTQTAEAETEVAATAASELDTSQGGLEEQEEPHVERDIQTLLSAMPQNLAAMQSQSAKLRCLAKLLPALAARGHRTLVFSASVKMLDLVQVCCLKPNGLRCLRIDGLTDATSRHEKVTKFNSQPDRFQCMLLTTAVGGVGLNLTSADRVILVDPAWNPATDAQAVDRAFRIGQTKEVRVYRLIMSGMIEDKMFRLQVFKMGLTRTALEAEQQQRYFTAREIRALFEWVDPSLGETRQMLEKKHGKDMDAPTRTAAVEDGAEPSESDQGWLQAGPAVGLSNFNGLFGGSVAEQEVQDDDFSAQVIEAKQKLEAADAKLQQKQEARQLAETYRDGLALELEEVCTGLEQIKEQRSVAEEALKEKRVELTQARRAESSSQLRFEKAARYKVASTERLALAEQVVLSTKAALELASDTTAEITQSAASAEESFKVLLADAEAQLAIVDDQGCATNNGAVDACVDRLRKAQNHIAKVKSAMDACSARQEEYEQAEQGLAIGLSKVDVAEPSSPSASSQPVAEERGTPRRQGGKPNVEDDGTPRRQEGTPRRRGADGQEQALLQIQQRVESCRESVLQAVQKFVEAANWFVESFVKTETRKVKMPQVKAAQSTAKAAFRPLVSSWQMVTKAREAQSKASNARRKASTKAAASSAGRDEAELQARSAGQEHTEAEQDLLRLSELRVECESALAAAETARSAAEQEEVQAKRRRDELKAAQPAAKDAFKAARTAEKEAFGERQALHAACNKREREQVKLEEAKNTSFKKLKTEQYDSGQVEAAYGHVNKKRGQRPSE